MDPPIRLRADGKCQESSGPARRHARKGIVSSAVDYGKSSPTLLHDVAPIAARAGRSTVVVLCDGKPAAWGTVVRKDGYIVTKASEVHGKLSCGIGGRELPATRGQIEDRARPRAVEGRRQRPRAHHLGRRRSARCPAVG